MIPSHPTGGRAERHTPAFSLVVSTLNRLDSISRLLQSLRHQQFADFEVLIVDQNDDDRVARLLDLEPLPFRLRHLHTPGERGLSRGRNRGWRAAEGEFVLFPDDDCWYPPWFLKAAIEKLRETGADILSGRATNEAGRSINGRFEHESQIITRSNVWTTQIEWVVFFRRQSLLELDGYDESIGVGAATPWQACEGQDIMLRALEAGLKCVFDPSIVGHHAELDTLFPDENMWHKARVYGRGMGFVLRAHNFGFREKLYWLMRPMGGVFLNVLKANPPRIKYYSNVLLGRYEGILGKAGGVRQ